MGETGGANALARILQERMFATTKPVEGVLDYGEILGDYSLRMNRFPKAIPQGDYMLCGGLVGLKAGARVLVARVGDDFCVIDQIHSSLCLLFGVEDEVD